MLSPAVFARRRAALMARVGAPVLLVGNGIRKRNLPINGLPFRQDSTLLYFTGCTTPGAALLLTQDSETLFLPEPADDDALWHGEVHTLEDERVRWGVDAVAPLRALEGATAPLASRLMSLAVPDLGQTELASRLTGLSLRYGSDNGPDRLVDAIIELRRALGPEEVHELRRAGHVTEAAHRAAMAATRPGRHERHIAALFDAVIASAGLVNAYESIVTVRGEILHNFHKQHWMQAGQLLLLDGGAEAESGYATDVTRTWPVTGRFTDQQRDAYSAVLEAQRAAIRRVRPGVRYRDVHDAASLVLARFLKDQGLLTVDPESAVERGAHALFFPHGVGHLIGLDVHDLENFGDRAAYAPGRARSEQFGTAYLRLDRELDPGNTVTIEPGFYIVPAIFADPALMDRFRGMVDLEALEAWRGFGGVRIEDDVLVTEGEPEVLTAGIPKEIAELEALVGTMDGLRIPELTL